MAIFTTTAVERFVRAGVPEGKPHASLRDGSGLVLRLLPTGAASWQYVYRMRGLGRAGTQRTVTIGSWPAVTCMKAIAEARTLAGKVASGNDPRAEIREAKQRERTILAAALDDYEVWLTSRRLMRVPPMLSSLRRGLVHLLSHEIKNLDRTTLIDAIERIERSGRPGAAREFRQRLRSFVNRQLALGAIAIDPLPGYRAPAASKQDALEAEANGRALNEDEIHAVWRAAEAMGAPFGGLVRMALLTGLRRNELASMCWSWIDRDALRIAVPAASMKSGREHSIPLTPMIIRLLGETPNRGGNLLFPSERRLGGSTPLAGWSHLIIALRQASGVEGFGLHDLRRTYRSALADLGVREELAELMIAHRRTGLIARYNKAQLWDQRREAAATYDAWLDGVVNRTEGDGAANVVRLGQRAAP
jgi:integrase